VIITRAPRDEASVAPPWVVPRRVTHFQDFQEALAAPLGKDAEPVAFAEHRGRIVKRTGDGILIEFASAVDALRCALDVQKGMAERNVGVPPHERIELRIGWLAPKKITTYHHFFCRFPAPILFVHVTT